jgi:hypothetical protein
MSSLQSIVDAVSALESLAQQVEEQTYRLRLEGASFSAEVLNRYHALQLLLESWDCTPTLLVSESSLGNIEPDELEFHEGQPWRVVIGKEALAKKLALRAEERTVVFFSVVRMTRWAESLDPFVHRDAIEPDFSGPVTVRVAGLAISFGGPSLWVLPIDQGAPKQFVRATKLPEASVVLDTIHLNADRHLQVCPSTWALTWGHLDDEIARPWCLLSCMVLAATLVQELRRINDKTHATLKGTKRVNLQLTDGREKNLNELCAKLIAAVEWVYAERAETRLQLVMDRLSIDIDASSTLIAGLELYLSDALHQAQDSYGFVILDRKDAYHKELRELMKDMKAQADLYATKVRDLVASITRDALGVLVLVGFSFLGKFDTNNLHTLLQSAELKLLLRCLAIYLIISFVMQGATHWRDATLAYKESQRWLSVLQSYTSKSDRRSNFIDPLDERRNTLWLAIVLIGIMYVALAISVWNLPKIAQSFLF